MKYTSKCDKCGWETVGKATQTEANYALRLHMRRPKCNGGEEPKPKKQKRKQTAHVAIGFCPGCGMDLNKLATALAIAERMK